MTARSIRLERSRDGARADLRIEIPPVNVLDLASLEELARKIGEAPPARVLVLSGLPARVLGGRRRRASTLPEPGAIEAMLTAMRGVLAALCETPAVTLAAVSGACLGGGAELVCACDLVLVAEDARVGFPEIRLACFPPGAAALLPLRIGEARAADWILTGKTVSGREAAEAGFAAVSVAAAGSARRGGRPARGADARNFARALSRPSLPLLRRARRAALAQPLADAENAYRALAGSEDLARAVREFGAGRARGR